MFDNTNLFRWATSELSQDAFICWLLSWADSSCASKDLKMHNAGKIFVNYLLELSKENPISSENIVVKKQLDSADIVAEIGKNLILLIEDKTDTAEHGNQLDRYKTAIQARYPNRKILPIFCKTGNQSNYKKAKKSGYNLLLRRDFLNVLIKIKESGLENNIFNDFLSLLDFREKETQSFLHLHPNDWSRYSWQGFFLSLQEVFPDLNWGYVANAQGGFMGAWWHFGAWSGWQTYLQIEEKSLVMKLGCWTEKHLPAARSSVRNRWLKTLKAANKESDITITPPVRRGNGRSMTAALVSSESNWIQLDKNKLIDFDATVTFLRKAMAVIDKARSDLTFADNK
ncbi:MULTISPECIES: PD-(D/E)XK nuclease family protein [Acetobacter]|uniref:PD-(D/E)XK nuclease superfamily protein n=1 Tax=Acetobacter pomorum DM001 TaxID=945681 RepID=F1YS49_9PROT|nr:MULTISPECIES: PD-(D/E)XK nuclease family protein [Acetobacter]ATI12567.1 hypothetical protein CPF11_08985 [Acetobacter pomorum]AXC27296.1 hypothetical protein DS739_11425 [Acetobacter sp. JWB]EGE48384.1 Hypothetical protein APO_0737 [Acetobacter pomorum DM001]KAA8425327.1 hypothetical protein FKW54_09475 [Acetobacter pomorum]KAA8433913.1 hypothetical protein FKW50_08905 [Acetobacter pomorum]